MHHRSTRHACACLCLQACSMLSGCAVDEPATPPEVVTKIRTVYVTPPLDEMRPCPIPAARDDMLVGDLIDELIPALTQALVACAQRMDRNRNHVESHAQ